MAASTPIPLSNKSQAAFISYYNHTQDRQGVTRDSLRARLTRVDKEYQRQKDLSEEQKRAKAANEAGDTSRYQNMVVPVVMPQVEAAVTYQASVFLTGHPLFGVTAPPKYIDEAMQLETVIEEQSIRGGWTRELMMFFRDGFKHNLSYLEVDWNAEVSYAVETNLQSSLSEGQRKEVIWEGNRVRRWCPYNTFVDTSVPPSEVYKRGEFAGHTEHMTRIELKSLIASLPDKIISNIRPAFESSAKGAHKHSGAVGYYTPDINPRVSEADMLDSSTNWMSWAGIKDNEKGKAINYKGSYEVTTLYCRVLPSEFDVKVPNSNTPQIYKLLIVNHEHIIYAELQTNAHNYIPVLIGQPMEDGLGYQTKSLAENGEPFQQLATSYMTSIIASRRRAITDRVLYDPSRISSAHINSPNPSAKIPVRPAAYGEDLSKAVYAFPYREDQASTSMQHISAIVGLANGLAGQNQAQQGQFVKGNKTLAEYEDVMQNANGRDQLVSILYESQIFTPMKHILKTNILQYQGGTTIYNREKETEIEVDPIKLRKAVMDFRLSDGLLPSSKILNSDSFSVALQVLGSSPQIAAGYNIAPLFSYFMKTQGSKIHEFEKSAEQQAYEQALQSWQSLAQTAMESGVDPAKLPPQPLPANYGYEPKANKPAPEEASAKGQVANNQSQMTQG